MKRYFENLAKALLGQFYGSLNDTGQKVIESFAEKDPSLKTPMIAILKSLRSVIQEREIKPEAALTTLPLREDGNEWELK